MKRATLSAQVMIAFDVDVDDAATDAEILADGKYLLARALEQDEGIDQVLALDAPYLALPSTAAGPPRHVEEIDVEIVEVTEIEKEKD